MPKHADVRAMPRSAPSNVNVVVKLVPAGVSPTDVTFHPLWLSVVGTEPE